MSSCLDDPEGPSGLDLSCEDGIQDLGTTELAATSEQFIPYEGTETLVFLSENGDTARFNGFNPLTNSLLDTRFVLFCEALDTNSYTYTRDQISGAFASEDLNLRFYLNVFVWHSNAKPLFYDQFNCNFHVPPVSSSVISQSISMNIVTDDRDNNDELELELLNYQNTITESSLTILDRTFTEVFVRENFDNSLTVLYYTKEEGVVGFTDLDQQLWVFIGEE